MIYYSACKKGGDYLGSRRFVALALQKAELKCLVPHFKGRVTAESPKN
jgi:hypothetical protein